MLFVVELAGGGQPFGDGASKLRVVSAPQRFWALIRLGRLDDNESYYYYWR